MDMTSRWLRCSDRQRAIRSHGFSRSGFPREPCERLSLLTRNIWPQRKRTLFRRSAASASWPRTIGRGPLDRCRRIAPCQKRQPPSLATRGLVVGRMVESDIGTRAKANGDRNARGTLRQLVRAIEPRANAFFKSPSSSRLHVRSALRAVRKGEVQSRMPIRQTSSSTRPASGCSNSINPPISTL